MKTCHSLLFSAVLLTLAPQTALGADAAPAPGKRNRAANPAREAGASRMSGRAADRVVVFKKTPQGELKAHIHFPLGWTAADQRPAIVFWVGGGFRTGGVGQFTARADYFASRGLVAVCAEYRGRDSHGIFLDSCAEDARSAMRWVKGRAQELGIAPERIIASGGSAGGCLSLLVAREKGPDAKDDDLSLSTRPSALILFNPAVGKQVMDTVGWGGPEQTAVNAQIAALGTPQKDEPPVIMFFGSEDRFLIVASEFHRKASAQRSRCELWVADGQQHGFFNRQPWHDATSRLADAFLVSLGYLQGGSPLKENPAAPLTLAAAQSALGSSPAR